ncbi:MAG: IMP dehydrogenase [Bacteroidetes bacterium]|nr:IMP dehydrogenase [Bacteroidota bacterium]
MKSMGGIVSGRPLYSIARSMTVAEAAVYMAEKNIGAVPVVEGERLVGVFSERDIVKRVVSRNLDPKATTISDVMTSKLVIASADESFESCLQKMQKAHCRHLPIVSGDQLIGFVSLRDLLMIDIDEKERNLEYLQSYIYMVPPGAKKYQS